MPLSTKSIPVPPQQEPLSLRLGLAAAIFILTFLPFIPAIHAGFSEFDDHGLLIEVKDWRGLALENLRWIFSSTHMGHYQPLTWISYATEFVIWGMNPVPFHINNILIHCLNAVLVFHLAARLLRAGFNADPGANPPVVGERAILLASAAAALLFSIHPLRVESVAWITERRDVLSTCFLLATTLAYLRAFPARSVGPASVGWYIASIVLLLVSLLCKAWGMTFFVVAFIIDWYPLRRLPGPPWRWLAPSVFPVLIQKLPYILLGIAFAIQAGRAQSSMFGTVRTLEQWGIGARICQAAYGLLFYLQKFILPIDLACLYQLPARFNPAETRWWIGITFTLTGLTLIWLLRGRFPALVAVALAYAILLAPILGVFQSGIQLVADRYSYVANIGWAVLAAGGLIVLFRKRPAQAGLLTAAAAVAFLALGALTWRQTGFWQDTRTLFVRCLAVGADGPIVRESYGRLLSVQKNFPEALIQFQTAIDMNPEYGEAWYSRANTLKELGRLAEAEQSYFKARTLMPDSWRADLMLGLMYLTRMERPVDAVAAIRSSVAKVEIPGTPFFSSRPYLMLAGALDETGDEKGCREMLQKAARYPETREEALLHLREMDAESGKK